MFFLASILFVTALYVAPGFWVLDFLARLLPISLIPAAWRFWGLAFFLYGVCVAAVRFGRWAYADLQKNRDDRRIKAFLDARGLRWMTLIGLLLIGAQFAYMSSRFAMPYQFVPLYGALLVGFFDLRRRPVALPARPSLPAPRYAEEVTAPAAVGLKSIRVSWEFLANGNSQEAEHFEKEFAVRESHLDRARGPLAFQPKQPQDYAAYVMRGPAEDIRVIASELRRESQERGYTPLQEMDFVVQMVRSFRYIPDDPDHEADQPKYPIETLADGGGDCEDLAILAAALLWQMGHPVGLFYVKLHEASHMALAYRTPSFKGSYSQVGPDGHVYTYMETVPASVRFGQLPPAIVRSIKRSIIILLNPG